MSIRRCKQTKCMFFVNGGCKPCTECESRPYKINTTCGRCLGCETRPNALRFDNAGFEDEQAEQTAHKVVMVVAR